jgi:hypothetical protein
MVFRPPQFATENLGYALKDISYGLANSPTIWTGLGQAAVRQQAQQPYRDQMATVEEQRKQEALEKNQTSEWVKANFPQYSNLPPAQAWSAAMAELTAKRNAASAGSDNTPANIREWNTFSEMTPEQQTQYLIMKRANPYLDLGTGFQAANPAQPGTTAGPMIQKDNFTPAYDAALGKGAGTVAAEVGAEADSLASKLPGIKAVVAELGTLAEQATYTHTGQLWDNIVRETGEMPSEGALARTKYMAMVDNQVLPLLRDVFGAAFTVKEGETLRATLGAPDKSPAEKKAVLEAFIEQKTRDLQALQSRAGSTGGTTYTFNPATGELE